MQAFFEEAIKFAFKDRSWILKIVIGGVLGLIPIVNLIFLIGYSYSVLKDSVDNKPAVLPEWSNWIEYAKNGLTGLLILIVWGIPLILLGILATTPTLGKLFYILFVLANFIVCPLFSLALIAWYKQGALKAAFGFKEIWDTFAKNMQNYVIATLILGILPVTITLILQSMGIGGCRGGCPLMFFPGAFIQFLVGCLWFWLSVVGSRVIGQIYITAPQKKN